MVQTNEEIARVSALETQKALFELGRQQAELERKAEARECAERGAKKSFESIPFDSLKPHIKQLVKGDEGPEEICKLLRACKLLLERSKEEKAKLATRLEQADEQIQSMEEALDEQIEEQELLESENDRLISTIYSQRISNLFLIVALLWFGYFGFIQGGEVAFLGAKMMVQGILLTLKALIDILVITIQGILTLPSSLVDTIQGPVGNEEL